MIIIRPNENFHQNNNNQKLQRSDVIVWMAGQNITPLLVSVEFFENNIQYAYYMRILFFESHVSFLRMIKYNTRMLELWDWMISFAVYTAAETPNAFPFSVGRTTPKIAPSHGRDLDPI